MINSKIRKDRTHKNIKLKDRGPQKEKEHTHNSNKQTFSTVQDPAHEMMLLTFKVAFPTLTDPVKIYYGHAHKPHQSREFFIDTLFLDDSRLC